MSPAGLPPLPDDEDVARLDAWVDAGRGEAAPAGGEPTGAVDPALAGLVGRLRALPEAHWEAAVPLASLAAPDPESVAVPSSDTIEDEPGAARSPYRRRSGPRAVRRRRGRAVPRWVAVAAVVVVVAAGLAVAFTTGGGGRPNRSATSQLAAWRLAGSVQQPAWADEGSSPGSSVSITCPTATDCYADAVGPTAGTVVEVSTDGGSSWRAEELPAGSWANSPLSCPAADRCLLAGATTGSGDPAGGSPSILVTSDGGLTWTTERLPPAVTALEDIACPSSSHCVAAGFGGGTALRPQGPSLAVVTDDDGASWTVVGLPGSFTPVASRGLSCPTVTVCALGGSTTSTVVPTSTSTSTSSGTGPVAGLFTTDGGRSWSSAHVAATVVQLRAVSCGGLDRCLAVAYPRSSAGTGGAGQASTSIVLASTNGGRTWAPSADQGLPPALLVDLTCTGPATCWAAGNRTASTTANQTPGLIIGTTDSGQTWHTEQLPSQPTAAQRAATGLVDLDIDVVTSLSCPTPGDCLAVAQGGSLASPTGQQLVLSQAGAA